MSRRRGHAQLLALAPVFSALGDETRLQLVARLGSEGPLSITSLSEGATITRQAVAKHLRSLATAGLVRSEQRGREHVYELDPRRIDEARHTLDRLSAEWDVALERLRRLVESGG